MLGLGATVELQVAKNLPPALLAGGSGSGGGGANANAFRNSYLWQVDKGVLHIHGKLPLVHSAPEVGVRWVVTGGGGGSV